VPGRIQKILTCCRIAASAVALQPHTPYRRCKGQGASEAV
jgi:hypothetical protein